MTYLSRVWWRVRHVDCHPTAVLYWGTLPVWLPLYLLTWGPYACTRKVWGYHIGPVREYPQAKPIKRRRGLRRQISAEALESLAKAAEAKEQQPPPTGFWKLPLEIRLMIWKELLLLEWDGFVEVLMRSNRTHDVNLFSHDVLRSLDPTLLRVGKRFYLEGMDILYNQNEFRMQNEATLSTFARCVAPSRLAQITSLRFSVDHHPWSDGRHKRDLTFNSSVWKEACQDLRLFTQLRQLRIFLGIDINWRISSRCARDPQWCRKLFASILDPLVPMHVVEDGEFVVAYTWPEGLCDEWPTGSFEMRYLGNHKHYDW